MTGNAVRRLHWISLFSAVAFFTIPVTFANGPIGDHVNHLSDNLETYSQEVNWLNSQVNDMISRYEKGGVDEAKPDLLIEYWEEVKFHSAIETSYVPVYALIWQGLFGVKTALEENASIDDIRKQQRFLEQSLWQALGAVKLAAQFQDKGLTEKIAIMEANPENSMEALDLIKSRLDRVVAKYAEKLPEEAVSIVHDSYLNLFEGVEGELISLDADLVEDLEKAFNVLLPQTIQNGGSIDELRQLVNTVKSKIDTAQSLLQKSAAVKKDVF